MVAQDESHVVNLTKDNWDDVLGSSKYTLVKFFAPWCGHCKAMAGDYISAAKKLKEKGYEVTLGEVDATVESELASKWEVQGYPTLYWFVGSNKKEYTGARTEDGIIEWIEQNMGPALKTWTADELDTAIKNRKWGEGILAFKGDAKVAEIAGKIADDGKTFGDVVYVESSSNDLTIYKGTSETSKYEGAWELETVSAWSVDNRAPMFGQINEDNFEIYVEAAKEGLFWVCFDPSKHETDVPKYSPIIVEAAKEHLSKNEVKYPFVWLDISEFEAHAKEELGCSTYPTIVLQKGDLLGDREDTKVMKYVRSFSEKPEELTAPAVKQFFADIESGALEAVPEPDELAELDEEDDEGDKEGEEGEDGDKEEL